MQNTKENYQIGLPDHQVYLSDKGKMEAKEAGIFLKKYLEENNIDIDNATLWVSPYERTRETARIINEEIKKVREMGMWRIRKRCRSGDWVHLGTVKKNICFNERRWDNDRCGKV